MAMEDAVIISAVRTPIGRYAGSLKDVRPDDLAALVITEAIRRANIDADSIEDVILAVPTRPVRITGTSRVWPYSWQVSPSLLPGRPSTGSAAQAYKPSITRPGIQTGMGIPLSRAASRA